MKDRLGGGRGGGKGRRYEGWVRKRKERRRKTEKLDEAKEEM